MALGAIKKVKEAEAESEQMINYAIEKAKEVRQLAKDQAEKEYNEVLNEAKKKCSKILEDAISEGNMKAEPILSKGVEESKNISNISEDIKNKAVKLVVERIVKIDGNS